MPAIKYKPSADCAYTQLISKIKGVHEQAKATEPNPPKSVNVTVKNEPKTDVEVKKISNGLMLAQYYNSDSEDEESNQTNDDSHLPTPSNINHDEHQNGNPPPSVPTPDPEVPLPSDVLCPPPELRAIIEKTASYVLKNGKEFEEILRTKNDQRFTFLHYTDPYNKYYIFKLTGLVCPSATIGVKPNETDSQLEKPKTSLDMEMKTNDTDASKLTISKCYIRTFNCFISSCAERQHGTDCFIAFLRRKKKCIVFK